MIRPLAFALLSILAMPFAPLADEGEPPVPATITFVVSTGFWEELPHEESTGGEAGQGDQTKSEQADGEPAAASAAAARRGYYKLIAVRQPDGTAEVHLQQIESTPDGPKIVSSTELEEFTALKPYVTDIRPENSAGITRQPGLFATVYLKTDPATTEPDSWTVLIDDLGDIRIERATN